jgi:hypothetical protein
MGLGTFNANGFFHSSFNATNLNQKSFSNMIMRLFPEGSSPLYALTGEVNRKIAKSVTHGYWTKHMAYTSLTVNGAIIDSVTTLVVDSTAGLLPNMTFQVPTTREVIRINTVTNATTLEIDRSFGRVAAATIPDNAVCKLIGNATPESQNRPTARSIATVWVPNYTVLIRNAWAVGGTTAAELAEAGFDNIQENKMDCMELHSTEIEGQLLWGQAVAPATDATTGDKIHATQGLVDAVYEFAADNVDTANATTTYAELVALTEGPFQYSTSKTGGGNKMRTVFCDSQAMKVFHEIGDTYGQITLTQKETSFGMQYTSFNTYKGRMNLVEHPLLTESAPAAGIAILVDLPTVGIAYLKGRDVKREEYDGSKDGSNSGIDATGGSLLSEFATEFMSPQTCGVINGLTAAA